MARLAASVRASHEYRVQCAWESPPPTVSDATARSLGGRGEACLAPTNQDQPFIDAPTSKSAGACSGFPRSALSLEVRNQERQGGRRHAVEAAGLADGARARGLQLLPHL